jgi:DegV family protein with EDD domain
VPQPVAILTDSCASIPETLLHSLQIHTVAYYIHRGSEVLRDLVTVQRQEFLRWLPTARRLPTTASPGPGDYLAAYSRLAHEHGALQIASIHMTSLGSGAYQAARAAKAIARQEIPGVRIEVIDTLNVSMAHGWMVIEAARAALAGMDLDRILDNIQRMLPVTRMIQTADTLRYLYLGGRIGSARRLVGSLLNIHPLIGMADGLIVPLGQARSRLQAYRKMVDLIGPAVGPTAKIKVAYVHAAAESEIIRLRELVESRFECIETLVAELSPALAVHTGPGTSGLCYYPVIPGLW